MAAFLISDVLDAAGSASIGPNGDVVAFTIDQYIDEFYQLDFVFTQELWRGLQFKTSIKNLTDTERGILYDPDQTTSSIYERQVKIGRDYSFSVSFTQEF